MMITQSRGVTKDTTDVLKIGNVVLYISVNELLTVISSYIDPGDGGKLQSCEEAGSIIKSECPSIFDAIKLWSIAVIDMNVQEFVERTLGDEFRNYARVRSGTPRRNGPLSKIMAAWNRWKSRAS